MNIADFVADIGHTVVKVLGNSFLVLGKLSEWMGHPFFDTN